MHPRNGRNVELEPVDVLLKTFDGVFKIDLRPVSNRDTAEVSVGIVGIGAGFPGGYRVVETVVLDNNKLMVGRLVLLYSEEARGEVEAICIKSTLVVGTQETGHLTRNRPYAR